MGKKKNTEDRVFLCPVGRFLADLERSGGKKSQFFKHLSRSRIEFLKAFRSLVEERIEILEKKTEDASEKMRKIEVE